MKSATHINHRPRFAALSRRSFLSAMAAASLPDLVLGADKLRISYNKADEGQGVLDEMVRQAETSRLNTQDPSLAVHWPKNTVVYPSNIQERVSVIDENLEYGVVTHHLSEAIKSPEAASLFDAFSTLRKGVLQKHYGSYIPLAPLVPNEQAAKTGWQKADNGKKQRYVLLISGEGGTSKEIREHLKNWKNLNAAHSDDEDFAEFLMDQTNTNLILQYRFKLREEGWFRKSTEVMRDTLAETFQIPNADKNVVVEIDGDKLPKTTDDTRMVLLHSPSQKQVEHVMKTWLGPRQNKDAELLVFYNGHGEVKTEHSTDRRQGADEGQLYLRGDKYYEEKPVPETHWKEWLNRNAKNFGQVAVVLDCCHSGAFFAKQDEKPLSLWA